MVAHPERLSEELLRFEALAARRNVATWQSLVRAFGSVRGLRRRYLIEPRYLVEPHLRQVAVPTTFIWGEQCSPHCHAGGHPQHTILDWRSRLRSSQRRTATP